MSGYTLSLWQDMKDLARALFYEKSSTCLLCETYVSGGQVFCDDCKQAYFYPDLNRCTHCGKLLESPHKKCEDCTEGRGPKGMDQVVAWGHYTGAWREFIQDVKFKFQPYLLKRLGQPLGEFALCHLPPPNILVPVPMHDERLGERGFNQAAVIASLLHWELGIPLWEGLARVQPTTPQVGLSRKERLHNLESAFQMPSSAQSQIHGAKVWLIDDVTTTGATLEHCSKVLKRGGAAHVYGLVLAAGLEKRR
ncbi:ComF family protein [Desulfitobacterium sp. PCE1]|uniref:ComF family protein n=1 Tax=Desulfitobacterium sp. PCE1 TaxID=146907 RepID=UPI000371E482|nr:ComF family protein [Desulfitobacterium sp. PCE1]